MKVLVFTRVFTGFRESVMTGKWQPRGTPAIYRLLDALIAQGHETSLHLAEKEIATGSRGSMDLEGLDMPVRLHRGAPAFLANWPGAALIFSDLRHLASLALAILRERPDIVYFDYANLVPAGLLARVFRSTRFCLRMLGRRDLPRNRQYRRLIEWCFRAPFAMVIVTQDGSGTEIWADQVLPAATPRRVWLNGVDRMVLAEAWPRTWPENRVTISFLGRFEESKGPLVFLEAFLDARRRLPGRLHALMIGYGPLLEDCRALVEEAGAEAEVTFTGGLAHDQAAAALQAADVYVSLNRLGNLSNANLEAWRAGRCMVIPAADAKSGRDLATDTLLPADVAMRIPAADAAPALADAMVDLASNDHARSCRMAAARTSADVNLKTWNERIAQELDLLREVAIGAPAPARPKG